MLCNFKRCLRHSKWNIGICFWLPGHINKLILRLTLSRTPFLLYPKINSLHSILVKVSPQNVHFAVPIWISNARHHRARFNIENKWKMFFILRHLNCKWIVNGWSLMKFPFDRNYVFTSISEIHCIAKAFKRLLDSNVLPMVLYKMCEMKSKMVGTAWLIYYWN